MLRSLLTSGICILLTVTSASGEESDASKQLRTLFAESDASGNRSFVVETVTFQKRGDMQRESSATSTVYLSPKQGVIVINTGDLWYRMEQEREAGWTTVDSKTDVQRVRAVQTDAERSSNLARANHNVFWFIPTASNADYLLANFQMLRVGDADDEEVFSLKLADTPADSYWKNVKKYGLEFSGTLRFDPETGLPLAGKVTMLRDDYLREYRVKIRMPSMEVPESVLIVPKEVEEKARQKKIGKN